ncbi:MAG: RidA family protein [Gemmatimonadota bacterium]|nr:MAG: RidA family protein [Gemmatimonadota bacterium]
MTDRKHVHTDGAPAAIGPYSQAIVSGGFIFTAGQIALDPASGELVEGGVEAQAERALQNLTAVLEAAGSSMNDVVKTTMYLADIGDFVTVNGIYAKYFDEPFPARSALQAGALPKGALVEIDAIARLT